MSWRGVVVVFGIVAASGCGSSEGENARERAPAVANQRPVRERLEQQLLGLLAAKYEVPFKSATCPDAVVQKAATLDCAVVTPDGSELPVTVTWTGDGSKFEYADKGVILLDKVERALEVQLDARGTPGKVDCPGTIRASEPGATFDCAIAYSDGKPGVVTNKITGWGGHFTWEWNQD